MRKSIQFGGVSAVTIAFLSSLCASHAFAADAAAAATAADEGAVTEIVVAAEKREQNVETVPVAISAFTAKQRDIIGIKTVQDLSDFTPGLSYYAIADRAYIRGIGRNTVNLATASGVATYYNGVYYGANATIAQARDSLFIDQVSVERGPRNTLHGSNSDGGTINYVSARPTHSFFAEARAGVQAYGDYYAEAVVSGPISDNVRFRVGGNYSNQSGGFFTNLNGGHEGGYLPQGNGGVSEYFEAQVDANVGDHLDVWGMVSSGDYDTNFHTVATTGAYNDYEFPNPAGSLSPSSFYGLCALPSQAANPGCFTNAPFVSALLTPLNQPIVPGSLVTTPVNAASFPGNNPSNLNLHNFIETSIQHNRQTKDLALATNVTYHFPSMDLQYIGGWQTFYYHLDFGPGIDSGVTQYQLQGPPGFGNLTINPAGVHTDFIEDDTYYSHELNLISTDKGPVQWITGLYWYHEHFNQPIGLGCFPNQAQVISPANGPANPTACTVTVDGALRYDSVAGYGQVTWQIDPAWKVEFAGRYTADTKSGLERFRVIEFNDPAIVGPGLSSSGLGAFTPGLDITSGAIGAFNLTHTFPGAALPVLNTATGFYERNLAGSWGAWTGDAVLTWQPDEETMAYFRYARGYKTGGINAGTISAHPLTMPEYVDSFETGLKKSVGRTFQLNAALFYYNFINDQQPLGVTSSAGVTTSQLFNIGTVHTYGLELEAVWRPIEALTLIGDYSYLSSKVASTGGNCFINADDTRALLPGAKIAGCPIDATGSQSQSIVGNTLPEAPTNKLAFNANYVFTFDPGKLTLSGSVVWKDKTYGEIFNTPLTLAPAYSQVNLRVTWDDAKDRYNISAYVNNVFNTTGFDNVTETQLAPFTPPAQGGAPYDIVQGKGLTSPITYGIELRVRYR
ncbi:MAG: TonB-dependent receptor [Caulobacterales bacterium]